MKHWHALLIFAIGSSLGLHAYEILIEGPQTQHLGYDLPNIVGDGEDTLLREYLRPGQLVFDVGANIGEWTEKALEIQPTIHIKAFEPIPQVCELYRQRIQNTNATLFNTALSNTVGKQSFFVYGNSFKESGTSSLYRQPTLEAQGVRPMEEITITKTTTDLFCRKNKISKIDFMKIDVEGHELSVLQGARHMLKNKRIQAIQFEYGYTFHGSNITLKSVFDYLSDKRVLIFRLIPDGLVFVPTWSDSLENYRFCNYVAIRHSAVPKKWKEKIRPFISKATKTTGKKRPMA